MKNAANSLKNVRNLVFATVDLSENDIDNVDFSELPAFLFYSRKTKENPVRFRDMVLQDSLIAFLKSHVT